MRVLIDRLPGFWAGSPQVVELQRVLDEMVQAAGSSQADTLAQLFLPTATWGLSWWEQAYGITPASGQTEDQRRTRILGKIRGQGVATVALIQATAGAYVDAAVSVEEHPNEFRFTVIFDQIGAQPPEPEEMTDALNEIKPAHLTFDYLYLYHTSDTVGIFQELKQTGFVYYYKMPFQLGKNPFGREETEVPVDITSSIQQHLLDGAATWTVDQINSVRINGSQTIRDFEVKEAADGVVTVSYLLQQESVPTLSKVELLDGSGQVLASASCTIVLRGPTRLTQVLTFEEVEA